VEFFGINGSEFVILALVAVVVLGPEKLPEYAQKLAQLVRNVRGMADGARERLREEVGDEVADLDWRKLDPRQYDPRKIIRDALLDDADPVPAPLAAGALTPVATLASSGAVLAPGELAPFDTEAT